MECEESRKPRRRPRTARQSILDHVEGLCRNEGLAVLWATHLIDEVLPDSQVIVLHEGRILADGPREDVVASTGGDNIRDAFAELTRKRQPAPEGASAA